jgi:hypothetical protein
MWHGLYVSNAGRSTGPAGGHRDAIDVARVLALLVVVLGHLLLAVIDRHGGEVRGANLLALHPGWAALAALAPMPVFFAAAGWANATSAFPASAARLRTLVGLGAVVVGGWSAAVLAAVAVAGEPGVLGDGARIATQPLWFVAAYVPLAAAGRPLARLAGDHVVLAVGGCLALLTVLDVARFALDAPQWIGWPGFYLAWGTPWLLGSWWRARSAGAGGGGGGSMDERRVGLRLAVLAGSGCVVLVAGAGYHPALIDAVADARSNTTPPTLYTAVAAIAQVGLLLAGARALDRAGRRWRRLWDRAGEAAVGIYAWHLTALALCAGIIAAGLPVPDRLTPTWWLTRPVWWAAVLAVTSGFVLVTAALRTRLARRGAGPATGSSRPAVLGVVMAAAAGGLVGLRGPRSGTLAVLCTVAFTASWLLLGGGARHRGSRPSGATAVP